jgi:hypothetical protein
MNRVDKILQEMGILATLLVNNTFTSFILAVRSAQVIDTMSAANEDPSTNKFLEVALMLSYFIIPFVGLSVAIIHYREDPSLPIIYWIILFFFAGNMMSWMILLLDGKTIKTKSWFVLGLLVTVILVNFFVW